ARPHRARDGGRPGTGAGRGGGRLRHQAGGLRPPDGQDRRTPGRASARAGPLITEGDPTRRVPCFPSRRSRWRPAPPAVPRRRARRAAGDGARPAPLRALPPPPLRALAACAAGGAAPASGPAPDVTAATPPPARVPEDRPYALTVTTRGDVAVEVTAGTARG